MIMDLEKVEILLEKYYSGNTSLEEEQLLKDYFKADKIPYNLLPEKDIFNCFSHEDIDDLPGKNFEQKLIEIIESEANTNLKKKKTRFLYNTLRIASTITILFVSFIIINKNTNLFNSSGLSEIKDPEIAFAETKKTLLLISRNMNIGLDNLKNLDKINSGKREINNLKSFNTGIINLRKISIFDETKNLLTNKNK